MKDMEQKFYGTDFSKYTDLKERLAARLFASAAAPASGSSSKVAQFPFRALADDEIELVNAAQGIYTPDKKDLDK